MVFAADQSSDYGYWGWWQGQRVNRRTHDAILTAAKLAGTWGSVRITQGGLSMSVSASALTHAGLDVADIAIDGRPRDVVWKFCTALMKCGAVPFPRGYIDPNGWQDPWRDMKHIHLVMYNGGHAHRQAQDQINSATYGYRYSKNGLAGHPGPYTGPPQQPLVSWAESDYNPEVDDLPTPKDVWNWDGLPAPDPVDPDNPTWKAASFLRETMESNRRIEKKLDALAASLRPVAADAVVDPEGEL